MTQIPHTTEIDPVGFEGNARILKSNLNGAVAVIPDHELDAEEIIAAGVGVGYILPDIIEMRLFAKGGGSGDSESKREINERLAKLGRAVTARLQPDETEVAIDTSHTSRRFGTRWKLVGLAQVKELGKEPLKIRASSIPENRVKSFSRHTGSAVVDYV